jgi:hypothetical protein
MPGAFRFNPEESVDGVGVRGARSAPAVASLVRLTVPARNEPRSGQQSVERVETTAPRALPVTGRPRGVLHPSPRSDPSSSEDH